VQRLLERESQVPPDDRSRRNALPARQLGFTLVELMIVVVVVGILATIAYPTFTQQIIKANRSAAQSFMLNIASRQERYLLDARGYTDTLGAGGLNMTIPPEVADAYTIELVADNAATPPVYTIVALPVPGTRQVPDGMLSLDSFGTRIPAEKWQ
jgi:type IV pilus assembly protein PilE